MTFRTPRLLAVLLTGALVLGACGDDDDAADDPDETTTTTEASEPTGSDDEGADEGTDAGTADDGGTDDGGTADGGATDGGTTGGFDPGVLAAVDDFCDLDDIGDEAFDSLFSPDSDDPAERKAAFEALGAFYVRAVELAPAEIEGDIAKMLSGIQPLFELLEQHDYDFNTLYAAAEADPALAAQLEALEDPEMEAASERLDDWVDANCDD